MTLAFVQHALWLAAIALIGILAPRLTSARGSPVVLELVGGIVLGNLGLLGVLFFEPMRSSRILDAVSQAGVSFLLFQIGLASSLGEMRRMGGRAFVVALAGILGTMFLALLFTEVWIEPGSGKTPVFLAASLTATSVGISARILRDLGKARANETKLIVAAAVIDDILGLILLVFVVAILQPAADAQPLGIVILKIAVFFPTAAAAGVLGSRAVSRLSRQSRLSSGVIAVIPFVFWAVFALAALTAGLPALVGAFVGGLVLNESDVSKGSHIMAFENTGKLLVPAFFVMTGLRIDIASTINWQTLLLALALFAIAAGGKLACGLAAGKKFNRWLIGVGMMPRGEVQLIYASMGIALGVFSKDVFTALVMVVLATTLIVPPVLSRLIIKSE